jgi:nucleotide-binding universal stress UspA family protein
MTFALIGEPAGPKTHRLLRHFQPAAHLCLTPTLLPQIQRCKPPLFHGRKIPSCRSSFRHKEKTLLGSLTLRYIMQRSIRGAHEMAFSYGAQLLFVHVNEDPSLKKNGEESDTKHLARWKQKLGIDVPHKILIGRVAEVACREAAQEKADLVVIGRGQIRGMISRIWSHVYEIVRGSPCPVLSI